MKILVLNNYSFSRVLNEVKNKEKPSHHLYGIDALENEGHQLIILEKNIDTKIYKFFKLISKIPLCNLGNIELQFRAILIRKQYDLIYAPCQDCTGLLGLLSYFKLFHKPIIAIAHHPLLNGRFAFIRKYSLYFSTRGHFAYPALSKKVSCQINSIAKKNISVELFWGPDTNYYDSLITNSSYKETKYDIIAIGRTGRDYATLLKAFYNSTIRVGIYCNISLKDSLKEFISDNIFINWLASDEELNYPSLINIYRSAKILAIPMFDQDSLCGLTSVTDAIALGIPVIITKNKYINIDVEIEQIGYWVKPNNTQDWVDAANKILLNPTYSALISANSRQCSDKKFNAYIFSEQICKIVNQYK